MLENNKTGKDKTGEMAIQGTNETKKLQDWNKFTTFLVLLYSMDSKNLNNSIIRQHHIQGNT